MADSVPLTDLVTKDHFKRIQSVFSKNYNFPIETTGINGAEIRQMCSATCHPQFCKLVRGSKTGAKRCHQDRLRGLNISIETGQPYISLCHAGIALVCVPIMEKDTPLGGMFFGKCLWQPLNDTIEQDILKRLQGLKLQTNRLIASVDKLPIIANRKIYEAAEFLFILLYEVTELDPRIIKWRRLKTQQQTEIEEFIRENKESGLDKHYPYQSERELIGKVKIGDRTGAREILNSILGTILFQNPGDINVLKARLVELLTVLSRSAAEGGVDINLLLEKNLKYLNKVINIDSQEDLCVWISLALNDFIESVYTSQDARKITQVKPALEYMEACYDQPITLADIAKAAHLSISRLAHLFKEQMGITTIDYLTGVRIGHAKRLLLATDKTCTKICFDVGYNNQSYFTRIFKDAVGMTPRKFRESNHRKNNKPTPAQTTVGSQTAPDK